MIILKNHEKRLLNTHTQNPDFNFEKIQSCKPNLKKFQKKLFCSFFTKKNIHNTQTQSLITLLFNEK